MFYGFGLGVALANFMASSYYSSCCFFNCCSFALLPNSSSTTHFSLSFSHSILNGHYGVSLTKAGSSSRICAKFDKFQGEPPLDSLEVEAITPSTLPAQRQTVQEEVEEDDRFFSCRHLQLLSLSGYCRFLGFKFPSLRVEGPCMVR